MSSRKSGYVAWLAKADSDPLNEEFAYILATLPLVPESEKIAVQNAYRDGEQRLIT